jgi:hypothetical protein
MSLWLEIAHISFVYEETGPYAWTFIVSRWLLVVLDDSVTSNYAEFDPLQLARHFCHSWWKSLSSFIFWTISLKSPYLLLWMIFDWNVCCHYQPIHCLILDRLCYLVNWNCACFFACLCPMYRNCACFFSYLVCFVCTTYILLARSCDVFMSEPVMFNW